MQLVRQARCCATIPATSCLEVSRNVAMGGGTEAAMLVISASAITPGPLGMCETNPTADAPNSIANAASSTLAMQQIFTLGLLVLFMSQCLLPVGHPDI